MGEDGERVEERGEPATVCRVSYQPPSPLLQVRARGTWERTARERRKGGNLSLAAGCLANPLPFAAGEGRGHLGEDGERVEKRGEPATVCRVSSQPPSPLLQVRAGGTWERTARERRKGGSLPLLPLSAGFLTSPTPHVGTVLQHDRTKHSPSSSSSSPYCWPWIGGEAPLPLPCGLPVAWQPPRPRGLPVG